MTVHHIGSPEGVELDVLDQGATAQRLFVTGGDGVRRNVLLGHRTPREYLDSTAYLGATVGRHANRIAGGRFVLDGTPHQVGAHDRGNSLHGGPDGFDRRPWRVSHHDAESVRLELDSPDGDQGFPGHVHAGVTYAVTGETVRIALEATTDAPTLVNLTNHSYFCLEGDEPGASILEHRLRVPASRWTPVDAESIPLGDDAAAEGTPFDLRAGPRIADVLGADHEQLVAASGGIDHNLLPDGTGERLVAEVVAPRSRLRLEVTSDQPGLQVYTGNFLDGSLTSYAGHPLQQRAGLALEPQVPPDSPNRPGTPTCVLRPGETYRSVITWRFCGV